jgi:altronate hydrolase
MSPADNVAVALRPLKAKETVTIDGVSITLRRNIATGHKFAAKAIAKGEIVVKYNCPIGTAICAIEPGEYVHAHNLESNFLPIAALAK